MLPYGVININNRPNNNIVAASHTACLLRPLCSRPYTGRPVLSRSNCSRIVVITPAYAIGSRLSVSPCVCAVVSTDLKCCNVVDGSG